MATFLRPYRWQLALAVAISLVGTILGLTQPYLSKFLVDRALVKRDFNALSITSALMLAATLASLVMTYASSVLYVRTSAAMLFDMRLAVYRHLLQLSPRFYAKARLGDLASRLNGDVAEVQRISADVFLSVLSNFVFLVGSIFLMAWLSWRLFLVGIILIPLAVGLFRFYQRRVTALTRQLRERSADIGTLFIETLMAHRMVACFFSNRHELMRFRVRNDAFVDCLLRFQRTSVFGRSLPGAVLSLATIAVFLYGGREVIMGYLSLGTLVAFMAYHARLLSPVQGLFGLSSSIVSARVSLQRVLELLDTPIEIKEQKDPVRLLSVSHGFHFSDVTVSHDGREVLKDASFEIAAGRFTVLSGPSGCGKSTVADLMVRLIDPDHGSVRLDGCDLKTLCLEDLRRTVTLIEQTPCLLHGTLLENIAYARPEALREEVDTAARAAGLGDLLDKLPDYLDTVIGERGLTLSAGERQRVAVARAFLVDPQVVLLDEPSAALDLAHEKGLLDKVREHFCGRTVVLITHKPLDIEAADCVLTFTEGRVVETGVLV